MHDPRTPQHPAQEKIGISGHHHAGWDMRRAILPLPSQKGPSIMASAISATNHDGYWPLFAVQIGRRRGCALMPERAFIKGSFHALISRHYSPMAFLPGVPACISLHSISLLKIFSCCPFIQIDNRAFSTWPQWLFSPQFFLLSWSRTDNFCFLLYFRLFLSCFAFSSIINGVKKVGMKSKYCGCWKVCQPDSRRPPCRGDSLSLLSLKFSWRIRYISLNGCLEFLYPFWVDRSYRGVRFVLTHLQ